MTGKQTKMNSLVVTVTLLGILSLVTSCDETMQPQGIDAGAATDAGGCDGGGAGECTASGAACTCGICLVQADGGLGCIPTCDKVGEACPGGACYSTYTKDQFVCLEIGVWTTNEACSAINGCVAGDQCINEIAGDLPFCHKVCQDNSVCEAAQTCTDTDLGFSVCAWPPNP